MKKQLLAAGLAAALLLSGCGASGEASSAALGQYADAQTLLLSDSGVTLNGQDLSPESQGAVTVSHDIVYYRDGTDSSYGEGTEADMHSAREAGAHTVVTIREAGVYRVSGALSAGQLAVDLGEEARRDPEAVVTLVLDGVDITCTVAPAVIFYNVYECDEAWVAYDEGETEDYTLSPTDVDTSAAGANVVLAGGSLNQISGSYVARIYKEGTDKKLHKYDGAFYSKMSMNIDGEKDGTLTITAENEGLDSELHLTVNAGQIYIQSQNDGINTNEDNVSVTTINGGVLEINAGLGEEGDGIDSNGHIIINGGSVRSAASDHSPDGGLDADGEILINGGSVIAAGMRSDAVSTDSAQLYMELSFASSLSAGSQVELEGSPLSFSLEKGAQSLILSSPELKEDTAYTLKVNGEVQQYTGHVGGMAAGGFRPGEPPQGDFQPQDGTEPPQRPEGGQEPPDGQEPPKFPEGMEPPDGREPPADRPQRPDGGGRGSLEEETAAGTEFTLTDGVRSFSGITSQT